MKMIEKKDGKIKIANPHYSSGDWVAEIKGRDPKFGLERSFLKPEKDWSSTGKTGWSYYTLEDGKIYEISEPFKGRQIVEVKEGKIVVIDQEDVLMKMKEENK